MSKTKSLHELWEEGSLTATQYRSILFLMQTGPSFSSTPEGVVTNIDKKIELLTRIIEEEKKNKN